MPLSFNLKWILLMTRFYRSRKIKLLWRRPLVFQHIPRPLFKTLIDYNFTLFTLCHIPFLSKVFSILPIPSCSAVSTAEILGSKNASYIGSYKYLQCFQQIGWHSDWTVIFRGIVIYLSSFENECYSHLCIPQKNIPTRDYF